MNKLTVSIEKFHPLTVVYPDVDVIPAGTKLFIQLPPIKLYWGAAMPGLIDQQVTSEYPLYGYTMDFERATPLSEIAAFSASRSLNGTWVMPVIFGPKPSEYFDCPPTFTVNSVRP